MSLTSGFFDSKDKDRLYDASQLSKMFIGLISKNGVYSSIGEVYENSKDPSLCINPFKLTIINSTTFKIGKGLAYINGFFVYNDSDHILTIPPNEYYPLIPIKSIFIDKDPQIEYPSGNPIDLGDISVKEIESEYTVLDVRMDIEPQLDYPSGNSLDLGDIKVGAHPSKKILKNVEIMVNPQLDYPEGNILDLGDIQVDAWYGDEYYYIIIDFDEYNRTIDIKAVDDVNYNRDNRLVLYEIRREGSNIEITNYISRSQYNFMSTNLITGLMTSTNDIQSNMNMTSEYITFLNNWTRDSNRKFNDWLDNNKYYLWHSEDSTQYDRMSSEIDSKEVDPYVQDDVLKYGTTSKSIEINTDLTNKKIRVISSPYGLSINNIEVTDNIVTINYFKIYLDYKIKIIVR